MSAGKVIVECRAVASISQVKLSGESGVNRMKLSLVEQGYALLTPKEMMAVRHALLHIVEARQLVLRHLLEELQSF
jgi:hypothetical protein